MTSTNRVAPHLYEVLLLTKSVLLGKRFSYQMCRLMAFVSAQTRDFPSVVGENFSNFVELSSFHKDGWGIAINNAHKSQVLISRAPNARAPAPPLMNASINFMVMADCSIFGGRPLVSRIAMRTPIPSSMASSHSSTMATFDRVRISINLSKVSLMRFEVVKPIASVTFISSLPKSKNSELSMV